MCYALNGNGFSQPRYRNDISISSVQGRQWRAINASAAVKGRFLLSPKMSINAIASVFRLELNPSLKWILVCLADSADPLGGNIFPTITTISQKSGFPERTLQRHLQTLINGGLLEIVRPAQRPQNGKPGRGTEYRLAFMVKPITPAVRPNYKGCPRLLRLETIEVFQQTCAYCEQHGDSKNGPDGNPWEIDRIVPGSKGGSYTPENIALACKQCNMRKGAKLAPEEFLSMGAKKEITGANNGGTGAKTTSMGATAMAHDPSFKPSIDPSVGTNTRASQARAVFDCWRESLNHPRAKPDPKRLRLIERRLVEGFSVDDLCLAVRGCRVSPYHMGQNEHGTVYDDISLICRDAKHVEQFMARAQMPNGNGNGNGSKPKTQSERNVSNIRASLEYLRSQDTSGESNTQEPIGFLSS